MRKELHPSHEVLACGSCGRTILKGERTELYLTPEDASTVVCELCVAAVARDGWIRESERDETPRPGGRQEGRRSLWDRLRGPKEAAGSPMGNGGELAVGPGGLVDAARGAVAALRPPDGVEGAEGPAGPSPAASGADQSTATAGPKDPRHVRAVPMTAEVKVERALELFNHSEHRRTVAGIARSLGAPWVSAAVVPESSSEVEVVVAWEFSWYRYRVDLSDGLEPVALVDKGHELSELHDPQLQWNGAAALDGRLTARTGFDQ